MVADTAPRPRPAFRLIIMRPTTLFLLAGTTIAATTLPSRGVAQDMAPSLSQFLRD